MVQYVQIFAVISMFYPISALNINLLLAKGRADKFLFLEIIKKALLLLAILIGFKYGIVGILYGILSVSIIGLFFNLYISGKVSKYFIKEQLADLFPIVLVSLVYLLVLFFSKTIMISYTNNIIGSLISFLLSLLVLFTIVYKFKYEIVIDFKKIIKGYRKQ